MSECLAVFITFFSFSNSIFSSEFSLYYSGKFGFFLEFNYLLSNLMKHLKTKLMFSKVITTTMKGVLMFMKYCTYVPQ